MLQIEKVMWMCGGDSEDDANVWWRLGKYCGFVVEIRRRMWLCHGDREDYVDVLWRSGI